MGVGVKVEKNPILEVLNVDMAYPSPKRYREMFLRPWKMAFANRALTNINFTVEQGDSIAFLGPNGSGKTTLLKLLGGLLFPSKGFIDVLGKDTVRYNLNARKSVGFVLNEERSFYWRLTGFENLEFFGALDDLYGNGLKCRIVQLAELVGLGNDIHKRVSDYSSGMRQRLAIARGLLSDPQVLILDEPTKTLDPVGAHDLRILMRDHLHVGGNRTLLLATHNLGEAAMLCQKVCVVINGVASPLTTFQSIYDSEKSIDEYYQGFFKSLEVADVLA